MAPKSSNAEVLEEAMTDGRVPGTEPPRGRRRRRAARTQGFAVGNDGTPLYYNVAGQLEGGRTPVVLCDGIGCEGYVWKYLRADLGTDRAVVHWHYRGHGKTPLPRDPTKVNVSDCADDLAAVLDAAADNVEDWDEDGQAAPFDKVFVAGHSMGVQVALETYRRHKDRVAGLILVCGSYGTPLRTFRGSRLLEDLLPTVRLGFHMMPRAVGALWKAALPTQLSYKIAELFEINGALIRPEDFYPYLEHMAGVDVRLFVDMLSAMGRHTAREVLETIEVPTLIIAGDRDGFTPLTLSEEMHRLIPDSNIHIVRGGSHTAPIERPDEVTETIASFIRAHE